MMWLAQSFVNALWAMVSGLSLLLLPILLAAMLLHRVSASLQERLTRRFGLKAFLLLTAPGVVIHELSHAMFCPLFGHRIERLVLFRLPVDGPAGYIEHRYRRTNAWAQLGGFFISTGPLWGGTALLLTALTLLSEGVMPPSISLAAEGSPAVAILQSVPGQLVAWFATFSLSDWRTVPVVYLFIAVGSHITLSIEDLKGAALGFGWLLLILFPLFLAEPLWNDAVSKMMQRLVPWSFHGASVLFLIAAMLSIPLLLISMFEWINTRRQRPHSTF